MWHEARKQEKKIRGMMVDYKRRAERRRDYYERIKLDPAQFLQVHGRSAKIHLDPAIAIAGDSPATMMPWQGNPSNLIDRFDVRAHLDIIPEYTTTTEVTKPINEEDRRSCYERYRTLVQNDFMGVNEDKFLHQIFLEERFGPVMKPNAEEEKKKLMDKKAAIGYVYEDSTDYPSSNLQNKPMEEEEEEEEEKDDWSDIDLDITVDVTELSLPQCAEMNDHSHKYGMVDDDYITYLLQDKDEADQLRLAKEIEEEKAMFSGRKSRRERRALREKKLAGRVITSPPSYAAKESPTYAPMRHSTSRSLTRSPSPPVEKIMFITSFGDEIPDADKKIGQKSTESKKDLKKDTKSSSSKSNSADVIIGPKLPEKIDSKKKSHTSESSTKASKRSRSRSRGRRGRSNSRSRRQSRSNSRHRRRSRSSSRHRRRSRSNSRHRRRSRSSSRRRRQERSLSRSRRSRSRRRNRSSSRGRSRSSPSRRTDYRRQNSRQSSSKSQSRRFKHSSSSASPTRNDSRSGKDKAEHHSRNSRSCSASRSKSRSQSRQRTHKPGSGSRSRSNSLKPSDSPKLPPPPVKSYYRHSLSRSGSEASDSESPDTKDDSGSGKNISLSLSSKLQHLTGKAGPSTKTKITPQERLKRKMQLALNRQYKADKKAQIEKTEKQLQERMDRAEELREMAIKLRQRERERRHRLRGYDQESDSDSSIIHGDYTLDDFESKGRRSSSPSSSDHDYSRHRSRSPPKSPVSSFERRSSQYGSVVRSPPRNSYHSSNNSRRHFNEDRRQDSRSPPRQTSYSSSSSSSRRDRYSPNSSRSRRGLVDY